MTITIAYLYYNLLNLYGENGNIKMIKKILEKQGINVMVKFLDVTDELEFNKYDLVYMGSGNYENQELIIKHLSKYKKDIKKCLDNKKFFIITGNTLDIFGSHIIFPSKKIKALNIFDYYVKFEDINFADRALFKCKLIDEEIIGYQKQNSLMFNNNYSLFDVIEGIGENIKSNKEGVHYKNFYGTYLSGPFLIRNPFFTIFILKKLILNKDQKFSFKNFDLTFEKEAYYNYLHYNYGIIKANN